MGLNLGILCRNFDNYSNRRFIEAAEAKGHTARLIDYVNCDLNVSHNSLNLYYEGKTLKKLDAIVPRVSVTSSFYGLAVVRQFQMMGIYTPNFAQSIAQSRDKLQCLQILSANDVPVPASAISNSTLNSEKIMKTLNGAPLVIKLIEGMQGVGTILAETDKAAISVIEAFANLKTNMVLQEFVQEAEGRDIRVFIVGDQIVASMERIAKPGDFRSNLHRGGEARVVELTDEEKAISLKAAKLMGLNIAGVDLIRSSNGPLILEVNSSPGLEGIERTTGVDIAGTIIQFIENKVK